jgi:hypothetical protein
MSAKSTLTAPPTDRDRRLTEARVVIAVVAVVALVDAV